MDSVIGGEQTISFWFNAASTWNELIWRPLFDATPSGTFNWFMLARRANRLLFLVNTQSGFGLVFTPLLGLNAGEWHHFATTVDTVNLRVQIFVDGVLVGSGALPNANLANFQSLFVGDGVSGNAFLSSSANGLFDELRIYRKVLQPLEIQADMNATHPCPILLDEFDIDHDGFGIHCVAEPIAVTAEDISNNPVVNYDRTVTLDTGSGRGDWSINTGNGVLVDATPDDGIAMYTYDNIDGGDGDPSDYGTATFDLSYVDGPSPVNIAVTEAGFTDDDLEGPLRFSPVGFLLDPVPNQVAATDFLLSLTAYGQLPPAPSCGPILSYAGPKDVGFWANYYDPGVGITNATVDANPIAMSEAAAATQSVTFAAGQATLTTKYKDAGQIGINAKDDQFTDPSLPSGISGATNPFVVIPADFEFTDIQRTSDGFPNQAAADASGLSFMAAGDAFTVRMTALDAEGDATPNFGQESVAEEILLAQALLAPVTGNNPPLLPGNRIAAFSGGQGTRTDLHWDEVGIIAFTPSIGDGDYLGAGDVMGTGSGSVGRFVPDRFDVNVSVGGDFADACSGFTYMDQTFYYQSAPALRFVALNSGGATTLNYGDSGNPGERFWKLNTTFAARGYINQAASGSAMFLAVNAGGVLVIGDADLDGEGIIALEASAAGDRFLYQRQAVEAPFPTSVDLDLTVADLSDDDGVCFDSNDDGACEGLTVPTIGNTEQRFGRLVVNNAFGTELMVLAVPAQVEYFNGAGFMANGDDVCSSVALPHLDLANLGRLPPDDPPQGTPTVLVGAGSSMAGIANTPVAGGQLGMSFTAPAAGNTGDVDLRIDLGITMGAAAEWLRFDWDGDGNHADDPSARISFGIFSGQSEFIYTREPWQ